MHTIVEVDKQMSNVSGYKIMKKSIEIISCTSITMNDPENVRQFHFQ